MTILRLQHSFQGASGIARDQYVNTFHFKGGTPDSATYGVLAGLVKNFYTSTAGAGVALQIYLAGQSDSPGARIKIYNIADGIPRHPVYDETYDPGPEFGASTNPLPSEVACCLSYAADPQAGIPLSRTRGRIYIGPLSQSAVATTGITNNGIARPDPTLLAAMVGNGKELAEDVASATSIAGLGDFEWCVYSPTAGAAWPIARLWSDNAWDTQRRRGDAATARNSQTVA